jgi:hypothetical protein
MTPATAPESESESESESGSIEIATFDSALDNAPKPERMTLAELIAKLTTDGPVPCDPCPGKGCELKKRGPAWAPVRFTPCPERCHRHGTRQDCSGGKHHRIAENALEISALVIDLDKPGRERTAEIVRALDRFSGVIHSTHCYAPEKGAYNARAVIWLSRPVPGREWKRFWNAAVAYVGLTDGEADSACSDPARLYFWPSRPANARELRSAVLRGAPLDVDAVLAHAQTQVKRSSAPVPLIALPPDATGVVAHFAQTVSQMPVANQRERAAKAAAFRTLVQRLDFGPRGGDQALGLAGQDAALFDVVDHAVFHAPDGFDREQILEYLQPLLDATDWGGPSGAAEGPLEDRQRHFREVAAAKVDAALERKAAADAKRAHSARLTELTRSALVAVRASTSAPVSESDVLPPVTHEESAELPCIEVTTRLADTVQQGIDALSMHPEVFQRGGVLIRMAKDSITPMTPAVLTMYLSACARWSRLQRSAEEGEAPKRRNVLPPKEVVGAVHGLGFWSGIRSLNGVVHTPMLRQDGSLLVTPGYDPATGLFLVTSGEIPQVPENPTRDDAVAALAELLEVTCDVPFINESHRAASLATLLTLFARPAIDGPTPFTVFDAPARGSGKTLQADINGIIWTGDRLPRRPFSQKEEELRKVITAVAIAGKAVVLFDNIKGRVESASLEAVTTGTAWEDRILQTSQDAKVKISTLWIATGNNTMLGSDMARRTLLVRIEPDVEDPEKRIGFRHPNLERWVRENRIRLQAAALTVLKAYFAAGLPDQRLATWGGFEAWSHVIRGALVWAGAPDPAGTRSDLLASGADSEADQLLTLLRGIQALVGAEQLKASEILRRVVCAPRTQYDELIAAVQDLCGGELRMNATVFGRQLHKLKDRRRAGLVLRSRLLDGTSRYWVAKTDATNTALPTGELTP